MALFFGLSLHDGLTDLGLIHRLARALDFGKGVGRRLLLALG